MVEKLARLAAYLPLAGTALILILQDFVHGFLSSFTLGPAVASMAVSIILLIWYFETALRREERSLDRLSAEVSRLAGEQQKIAGTAAPNLQHVSMNEAFQIAAGLVPSVKHLRVYAVTSQQIISFLQHSGITAERCSLLIRKPTAALPLMASQLDAAVAEWKALAGRGLVGSLEIRRYDFPPLEYEVIFDSAFMILGLYDPGAAKSSVAAPSYGTYVRKPFAVDSRSPAGAEMISEYSDRFDCLFEWCREAAPARKGRAAAGQGRSSQSASSKAAPNGAASP
jgi:hypothetical protein